VPRPCPVLRRWARDADLPVGSLPGRAANRAGRARHGIWWRAEYSNAGSGEREVDAVGRFGRTVAAAALVCRWTLHRGTESGKETSVLVRLQTPEVATCGREFSVGAAVVTWKRRVVFPGYGRYTLP
jgi:hypothetical protein